MTHHTLRSSALTRHRGISLRATRIAQTDAVITRADFFGFPCARVSSLLLNNFYAQIAMPAWAAEEFSGAELGDGRLNRRLIKLAATFADRPIPSIPGACQDTGGPAQLDRKSVFLSNISAEF